MSKGGGVDEVCVGGLDVNALTGGMNEVVAEVLMCCGCCGAVV